MKIKQETGLRTKVELGYKTISELYPAQLYDRAIEECHPGYKEMHQVMIGIIEDHNQNWGEKRKKELSILEVGAGTGILTAKLARKFSNFKIVAVEPDIEWFNVLQAHCLEFDNVQLHQEDIRDFQQEKDSNFDVIVLSFSFHHLPYQSQKATLEKLKQMLSEDGVIIVGEEFIPKFDPDQDKERVFANEVYHGYVIAWEELEHEKERKTLFQDAAAIEAEAMIAGMRKDGEYKLCIDLFDRYLQETELTAINRFKSFPFIVETKVRKRAEEIFNQGRYLVKENGRHWYLKTASNGGEWLIKPHSKEEQEMLGSAFKQAKDDQEWGIFVYEIRKKKNYFFGLIEGEKSVEVLSSRFDRALRDIEVGLELTSELPRLQLAEVVKQFVLAFKPDDVFCAFTSLDGGEIFASNIPQDILDKLIKKYCPAKEIWSNKNYVIQNVLLDSSEFGDLFHQCQSWVRIKIEIHEQELKLHLITPYSVEDLLDYKLIDQFAKQFFPEVKTEHSLQYLLEGRIKVDSNLNQKIKAVISPTYTGEKFFKRYLELVKSNNVNKNRIDELKESFASQRKTELKRHPRLAEAIHTLEQEVKKVLPENQQTCVKATQVWTLRYLIPPQKDTNRKDLYVYFDPDSRWDPDSKEYIDSIELNPNDSLKRKEVKKEVQTEMKIRGIYDTASFPNVFNERWVHLMYKFMHPADTGISGWVSRTYIPEFVINTSRDSRIIKYQKEIRDENWSKDEAFFFFGNFRDYVVMPIFVEDCFWGILLMFHGPSAKVKKYEGRKVVKIPLSIVDEKDGESYYQRLRKIDRAMQRFETKFAENVVADAMDIIDEGLIKLTKRESIHSIQDTIRTLTYLTVGYPYIPDILIFQENYTHVIKKTFLDFFPLSENILDGMITGLLQWYRDVLQETHISPNRLKEFDEKLQGLFAEPLGKKSGIVIPIWGFSNFVVILLNESYSNISARVKSLIRHIQTVLAIRELEREIEAKESYRKNMLLWTNDVRSTATAIRGLLGAYSTDPGSIKSKERDIANALAYQIAMAGELYTQLHQYDANRLRMDLKEPSNERGSVVNISWILWYAFGLCTLNLGRYRAAMSPDTKSIAVELLNYLGDREDYSNSIDSLMKSYNDKEKVQLFTTTSINQDYKLSFDKELNSENIILLLALYKEILSNALKYADSTDKKSVIKIKLETSEDYIFKLQVQNSIVQEETDTRKQNDIQQKNTPGLLSLRRLAEVLSQNSYFEAYSENTILSPETVSIGRKKYRIVTQRFHLKKGSNYAC